MIISFEGRLESRTALGCVIVAGGIGYEIAVPLTINLPLIGEQVKLFTYVVYREDNQSLYGFNTLYERNFFKLVVEKVSGIGPKIALAMLSKFRLEELHRLIVSKDAAMIASVPGIGRKTSEKLILELSDKLDGDMTKGIVNVPFSLAQSDAVLGLVALGYKRSEADLMITSALKSIPDATADLLIKYAIKVR